MVLKLFYFSILKNLEIKDVREIIFRTFDAKENLICVFICLGF